MVSYIVLLVNHLNLLKGHKTSHSLSLLCDDDRMKENNLNSTESAKKTIQTMVNLVIDHFFGDEKKIAA